MKLTSRLPALVAAFLTLVLAAAFLLLPLPFASEAAVAHASLRTLKTTTFTGTASISDTMVFTDHSWMREPRDVFALAQLTDGRVIVAGGTNIRGFPQRWVELYDPVSGTFTDTDWMTYERAYATATTLPNGNVLVVGGTSQSADAVAELYDATTGTFTSTGRLNEARSAHTATLLQDGRVLIAGGRIASAELYDPATGLFTLTGEMSGPRSGHTATRLQDGRVLIAGGYNSLTGNYPRKVEVYDPATGQFSAPDMLPHGTVEAVAALLPDGNVLVVGGTASSHPIIRTPPPKLLPSPTLFQPRACFLLLPQHKPYSTPDVILHPASCRIFRIPTSAFRIPHFQ